MEKNKDITNLIESLSPIERKVLPLIDLSIEQIAEKSGLDNASVMRALTFLENKKIINVSSIVEKIIDLGTNGIFYKKNGLPERKLLTLLERKNTLALEEAIKESKLTDNEFKVALGTLKKKALINLVNGKMQLSASKEELTKKSLEEQLIDSLPRKLESLPPEMMLAYENLKSRKDIIIIEEKKTVKIDLSQIAKILQKQDLKIDLIEEITPEIIKTYNKTKKFRRYDLYAPVPKIYGGKKHFVNQSIEYAKKIWTDLGFKEMNGSMVESSFWVFDSLFTPQDHPAREMQDTFFIKNARASLPDKKIIERVKEAHEKGLDKSKGWQYKWSEDEARKLLLRTHTTAISARTISSLKETDLPAKFFTIGKAFRNETVDWSHGFEFYQTEGIVIDKNVNFTHLLGYLKEFYKKMGYEKIKFLPTFFAYTEPSVEVQVFHPIKKKWLELGGAGMFRPEVTIPLLGKNIPILAWGQGFDRIIMEYHKIQDLREMYSNDLKDLRNKKMYIK